MFGGRRALGGGLAVAVAVVLAATGVSDAAVRNLVEAPTCARPTAITAGPALPGRTNVSFQVAARTRLRVTGGRVVAAATNTGCAPRATDEFVTGRRRSTAVEVRAALATFRSGDWTTPGTWHRAR